MIEYKPIETHSHTLHSDGTFTPEGLCAAVKEAQLTGVILSDHNTQSAFDYITEELQAGTVPVIHGIEWTTFFGHMLVVGAEKYIDWRFALPNTIDDFTSQIKAVNGAVGIAHPFNVGTPMCTGCHWNFNIENWSNVDYIEVWSQSNPHSHHKNRKAFNWWTELLNKGHRLGATGGRDWHGAEKPSAHPSATYIGVENGIVNTRTVTDALKAGRTFVTLGPVLDFSLTSDGSNFYIGDSIPAGGVTLNLTIDETKRREIWSEFNFTSNIVRIVNNGTCIKAIPVNGSSTIHEELKLETGWLRIEVISNDYRGLKDTIIAFTSPIYID